MGWKGTVRSLQASARRIEREVQRQERAQARYYKQVQKQLAIASAQNEVEEYEQLVTSLANVHKSAVEPIDWVALSEAEVPVKPVNEHKGERQASRKLGEYKPGFFVRLLGLKNFMRKRLEKQVVLHRESDQKEFEDRTSEHNEKLAVWSEAKEMSDKILGSNLPAFVEVVEQVGAFAAVEKWKHTVQLDIESADHIHINFKSAGLNVVPSEVKTFLKSGKVSIKEMPKSQYYGLYFDHVCSSVLSIAQNIFNVLPLKTARVDVWEDLLNSATGNLEEQVILSVFIPKETLAKMNFEAVDPSETLRNFKHNVNFKNTSGFAATEVVVVAG